MRFYCYVCRFEKYSYDATNWCYITTTWKLSLSVPLFYVYRKHMTMKKPTSIYFYKDAHHFMCWIFISQKKKKNQLIILSQTGFWNNCNTRVLLIRFHLLGCAFTLHSIEWDYCFEILVYPRLHLGRLLNP